MIQLASRKYGEWSTFAEKLVHLRCKNYVHSELIFRDDQSFSSSIRKVNGVTEGVRFRDIDYSKHPERWDIDTLPVPDEVEDRIRFNAEVLVAMDLGYDFRGITGFVGTGWHSVWDFFCSEGIYAVVAPVIFIPALNHKMDPERLRKVWLAMKQSYKPA